MTGSYAVNRFERIAAAGAALVLGWGQISFAAAPKNVILFIGDGMGFEQVKSAGYYFNGASGAFNFEQFDNFSAYTTHNASGATTDSAASGTAIATGQKVANGVISVANAGTPQQTDLLTLLEHFSAAGRSTGLVTTSYMTDATPAAFGAHNESRNNSSQIAADYFNQTRPNVLYGASATGFSTSAATTAGYATITNRAGLQSLDTETAAHVAGVFPTFGYAYDQQSTYANTPYLWEMTQSALNILDNDADGFFLMVENELTDSSGHSPNLLPNDLKTLRNAHEVRELEKAVQQAINWAGARTDTLILVASDHETGNLTVTGNNGQNTVPSVTWGSTGHTSDQVPVYASGANAHLFSGPLDNTGFFGRVTQQTDDLPRAIKRFQNGKDGYAGTSDTVIRQDAPGTSQAGTTPIIIDLDDNTAGGNQSAQALVKFDGLFGDGANQVPQGATITSAVLTVWTPNDANSHTAGTISIHKMLTAWNEDVTWTGLDGNGITLGTEAATLADGTQVPFAGGVPTLFDVTGTVQSWANGAANHGWALLANSTDGWRWYSSEFLDDPTRRPSLQITYVVPEPTATALLLLGSAALLRRRRAHFSGRASPAHELTPRDGDYLNPLRRCLL